MAGPAIKVIYFLISFVSSTWNIFNSTGFFYANHLSSGSLCSVAEGIHSLEFLSNASILYIVMGIKLLSKPVSNL